MKKSYLLFCCLFGCLPFLVSCDNDEKIIDSTIVGKWQLTKYKEFGVMDGKYITASGTNNTYREYMPNGKVKFYYADGTDGTPLTYTIEGETLRMESTESQLWTEYKFEITGSNLKLTYLKSNMFCVTGELEEGIYKKID